MSHSNLNHLFINRIFLFVSPLYISSYRIYRCRMFSNVGFCYNTYNYAKNDGINESTIANVNRKTDYAQKNWRESNILCWKGIKHATFASRGFFYLRGLGRMQTISDHFKGSTRVITTFQVIRLITQSQFLWFFCQC